MPVVPAVRPNPNYEPADQELIGSVTIVDEAGVSISSTNPLDVNAVLDLDATGLASDANQDAQIVQLGSVTEISPASDTASSGLNGRLQRIAQRLTSLIAQHPATLGQKTKASSFAVTLASDEDLLAIQGSLTETAPASDTASSGLNGRLQRISQRLTTLIGSVLTVIFPVRTWSDMTPGLIAITGGTDILTAQTGGTLNIIGDVGFQNITASDATLVLKKGGVTFADYLIPAKSVLEIGWQESQEWRFAGIFNAVAGTASAIKLTHGRYRQAAS